MTPIEKALAKKQEMKEQGEVITKETNPFKQYANKPTSKSAAIKAKCAECMGCTIDNIVSGWKSEVRECTATHCPLHSHRPFK